HRTYITRKKGYWLTKMGQGQQQTEIPLLTSSLHYVETWVPHWICALQIQETQRSYKCADSIPGLYAKTIRTMTNFCSSFTY
ncbi:hypothetical protein NPIL_110191, partial [Nephila pilipes]